MAIESLKIGDLVMTSTGIAIPIRWIGRRSYSRAALWTNPKVLPILIRADALAAGVPRRDLWVSPEHGMYVGDVLIPAGLLVNGISILREDDLDVLTYFHLEFDRHMLIYAEGAAAESFVDDESRDMFENAAQYRVLYPNGVRTFAQFCAPRVEDGEQLEAARLHLTLRANTLQGDFVAADTCSTLLAMNQHRPRGRHGMQAANDARRAVVCLARAATTRS